MKRGEFVRNLGLSSAALMAFYCMGTLTSCSSKNDPTPSTPNPTSAAFIGNAETSKGAVNFTLDLTSVDYKALKTTGEFVKVGDVLVANTKSKNFVAIQRLCTHQNLDGVAYQLGTDDFMCNIHGSVYALNGSVKVAAGGPGQPAMKLYKTALSTDGNKLTITA